MDSGFDGARAAPAWPLVLGRRAGILQNLVLMIAWLLLWRVSALMEYAPFASIWFPPAGLSFAALLLLGWRCLPSLMLCSIAVTFWTALMYHRPIDAGDLLLSGVAFGLAHCLCYGIGAQFTRSVARRSTVQSTPAVILTFLVAGGASALAATLAEIAALHWTGMLHQGLESGLWLPWWIGDMAGTLVLAPLCIGVLSWRYPQLEVWMGGLSFGSRAHGSSRYLAKLGLTLILVSAILLIEASLHAREMAFAMFFLIIPQMWIVYTESAIRSAISLAVLSTAIALWVAVLGLVEHALVYQFAICVIAASVCLGFAVPVLAAQNRQLRERASVDALTGVATREHFFELADAELAMAREHGQAISLVVLDVDGFKQINDAYGHVTGDKALQTLATRIRLRLRPVDFIGRFGGDEFTLMLPGLDYQHAVELTAEIQAFLRETPVPDTRQGISVSFGVAVVEAGETLMQAFRRADQALLEAKHRRHPVASAQPGRTQEDAP